MTEIVIASAARTPVGSFNGAFASLSAHALGTIAIQAALSRAGVKPEEVDEVIMGQILTAGAGQNPARQAAIAAGIPAERDRLRHQPALRLRPARRGAAAQQISSGDAAIVVAGGQESMTQAPHAAQLRAGQKMGDLAMVDTMIKDGLWDAFHGYHMGTTAENVAEKYQITREQQDAVRRRQPAQGRRGDEGRPLQGRDRPGDRQGPQGRRGDLGGRVPEALDRLRGAAEAPPGLQQDRHGDRRQCLRHQ